MIIKNAKVYTKNFKFEKKDLCLDGGILCDTAVGEVKDAKGMYIIPGLIDLHLHGCDGAEVVDGTHDAIRKIAKYEARNGITAICLSTEPVEHEKLINSLKTAGNYSADDGAVVCGINLEGPFLTVEKCGGNDARYLCNPSFKLFDEYQAAANGKIRIVDIAPDLEGSLELIRAKSSEIVMSLAHTPAGYDTAVKGFEAGATLVTHLFNGMGAFHHRDTHLIGAAMDCGAFVELIGDGMHVCDSMIRAAYRIFGAEKIVLISDSLFCAGLPDGHYVKDYCEVDVTNGLARLADNTINGASANLYMNMVRLMDIGIPKEDAVRMATYNPACVLGVLDKMGTLECGKMANFVITDEKFEICEVYVRGKREYAKCG